MMEEVEVVTKSNVNLFNIKWKIQNYNLLAGFKESIISPVFKSSNSRNKWQLKIYPKGIIPKTDPGEKGNNFSIYLSLESHPREKAMFASWTIDIMYSNGTQFMSRENVKFHDFKQYKTMGWEAYAQSEKILADSGPLGDDGTLNIFCSIKELTGISNPKPKVACKSDLDKCVNGCATA